MTLSRPSSWQDRSMALFDLDETDKAIIRELQSDGRIAYTKLGPLVATKNDEKLKADYVTELTAGDMVLIGPPKEEQGGDGLLPSAERP